MSQSQQRGYTDFPSVTANAGAGVRSRPRSPIRITLAGRVGAGGMEEMLVIPGTHRDYWNILRKRMRFGGRQGRRRLLHASANFLGDPRGCDDTV
jgi:hypothetical protein